MSRPARCIAEVDEEGRLQVPREVVGAVSMRPGDHVEVLIGRFEDPSREYWQQVVEYEFPPDFQEELHDLLQASAEGHLDGEQAERLDVLIQQVEWQTAQRARALVELQRLKRSDAQGFNCSLP